MSTDGELLGKQCRFPLKLDKFGLQCDCEYEFRLPLDPFLDFPTLFGHFLRQTNIPVVFHEGKPPLDRHVQKLSRR